MEVLKIKCPECRADIVVNAKTGKVVKHDVHKKEKASFDQFLETQGNRKKAIEEKFSASKKKSQERMNVINEKVDYAKHHLDEIEIPPRDRED